MNEVETKIEYISNIEKVIMNPVRGTLRALATSNGMNPTVLVLEPCLPAGRKSLERWEFPVLARLWRGELLK